MYFSDIDIEFDTYEWQRKTISAAAVKTKVGTKLCRFAKYKDEKSILPSILDELLMARKATKKLMNK